MKRVSFAYLVQLNLPGFPVKVGQSSQPRARFRAFDVATPVDIRIIGVTIDGRSRETAMLEATKSRIIKGEWRYPTQALRDLVGQYHAAGQWYVPVDDWAAHFTRTAVAQRVRQHASGFSVCPGASGYSWAKSALEKAFATDPTLGLDWSGFAQAELPPEMDWPAYLQPADLAA